jgi:stage V sporulation protein D (sporulation-specific penicillin-binding protein)
MRSTVTSGTGRIAQIPGYTVAGKTGTAEKIPRNKEDYYISFVGFVPAENPEIMVYVTIDEPHVKNQATVGPAVNLARQCLEDILPVLEMEPTEKISQSDLEHYELYTGYTWDPENRVSKKKKHKKK